ncbi:FHA domain-containing protein [Spirosomataceae bacterium TFI 002]|nr:FHA domain-containing protein [Spirosomataceae bacterium TFI 002]
MASNLKPEKYLIRHISGSKANQVEEFNFNTLNELSLGRSANSDVQFDPEEDSVVSREHGRIVKVSDDPYLFKIHDNNSRNGLFVNKQRVKAETAIAPGDEVQLGSNGPSFIFDIYPLPADMMLATRVIDIPSSVKPTTEMAMESDETGVWEVENQKKGVGKETVERLLTNERNKSNQTLIASIFGAVIVLSALGYVFRDNIFPSSTQTIIIDSTKVQPVSKSIIEVEEIATLNRKKVVKIMFSWRLYQTSTNEALWHEFTAIKDESGQQRYIALYVQNGDGSIEPKLTTSANVPRVPIGIDGASGTGFVISEDGFILTNSHVATNWNTGYTFADYAFPGLLVSQNGNPIKDARSVGPQDVYGWVPQETKQFGYNPTNKAVKGANTIINVTFADNDTPIPVVGEPIPSPEHDVALIKINASQKLPYVELDENTEVKIGSPSVVMGYPAITPGTFSVVTSKNVFNTSNQVREVAKPTTTTGTVTNILEGNSLQGIERQVGTNFGEAYQLQISETGGGNSGGPVFNRNGKVVGIFFAGNSDGQGTKVTYAIPIKYGKKLLNIY